MAARGETGGAVRPKAGPPPESVRPPQEAPDRKGLKAALTFVDPQVDARSGLFRVRFQLDQREHNKGKH